MKKNIRLRTQKSDSNTIKKKKKKRVIWRYCPKFSDKCADNSILRFCVTTANQRSFFKSLNVVLSWSIFS